MDLPTTDKGQVRVFADIGKILPEFFAVFEEKELGAVYVNPAGLSFLDPQSKLTVEKLTLPDIIGVNCIDRFQREIYPQARVMGSWSGPLVLRDLQGSEFEFRLNMMEAHCDVGSGQQRFIYVYASILKGESGAGGLTTSDQDMLHALLDMTPDRITFKDLAGRFLRVSRSKALAHNLTDPRAVIGKTDFDFFKIEYAAETYQQEQDIIKTGKALIDRERKLTYDDGHIAWASTTLMPFRNRNGDLIGTFYVSRDITARKQAEDTIRKSEAVLRGTFTAAPIGIALVEEREIRKVNDFLCEICGYSEADMVGRSTEFLYSSQEEFVRVGESLATGLKDSRRVNVEATWRRADGTPIEVLLSVARLDTDDSKLWKIVTVFDMTEKKRAERILKEKEAHLSEAQRIAHFGSWKRNLVRNELVWSDETRRIFGWPDGKPVTFEGFLEVLHPEDRNVIEERFAKAIEENIPIKGEYRIVRPDGEIRYVNEEGICTKDAAGKLIKLEGTVLDVTERKKATQERREMETRLQLAQKLESVGMLAAGVAHEINTPTQYIADNMRFLTGACSQVSGILDSYEAVAVAAAGKEDCAAALAKLAAVKIENELEYLAGEIPRTLEQSLEGLSRISRIVSSLKEFSHPNATEKSAADINRAIETTIAVSRHEWKYVADVETDLDPNLPGVSCVLDEINQVILNLIINATHAIADANKKLGLKRGRITLRTRQEKDQVIIEVSDTGTGIPPEVRGRIFEPFFTTKGIGKGTGQGLAIVHAVIVKGHNGAVDFTTEMDRGTTFRISLPHTHSAPPHPTTSTPLPARTG